MRKGEKNNPNLEVSKIQVFARCRPLNGIERKQDSVSVVDVISKEKKVVVKDRNREFTFDKVFPPDVKQIDVYKSVAAPLIQEVLKGFNCTILAYGQTGTGKTYTMEGERNNVQCSWEDDPGAGLIPRSLHQLFEELNMGENVEFSVRVSFLELYNEELLDLLSSKEDLTKLRIYEKKGLSVSQQETKVAAKQSQRLGLVHIDGLEEVVVNSKDEVYAILEKGTARRQTAATLLNASSSRSHTVFSVTVHIKENTVEGEELVKTGKLNLVDLAGSECVGRSGCVNQRLREAGNINMSLLTLGRVITALIENQPHVPYRESKLTRLLQDSLGGHTKTSFIATISPAQCNLEETMSTLDYATKAKNITNKPIINEKMTKRALIRELTEEMERLRKDLFALRNAEGFYVDAQNYTQILKQIAELEAEVEILKEHNSKIEESLTQTKEELQKKTKQQAETASKLMKVSETLCTTEKVLSKTALERDEKDYLLGIHHNKEKKLFEQNNELHQVVCESTDDVNKLHMKVERKQKVEISNEERLRQFKQESHRQFAHLDDLVNNLKHKQEAKLGNLQESLDGFTSGFMIFFHQALNNLNKVETELSSLNEFSSSLNNQAAEHKESSNLLLEKLNSKKKALATDQEVFCSENIPAYTEKFSSMMAEIKNWFLSNHCNMNQKIKSLQDQMRVQSEENCKLTKDILSNIEVSRKHHNETLITLLEEVNIVSSEHDQESEDLTKLYSLLADSQALLADVTKKRSIKKEGISSIEEKLQNLREMKSDFDATKKSVQTHRDTFEEQTASNSSALDDIASTIKADEATSQLDSAVSFYNSETSEIITFIKNNQQKQDSSIEMIKDEVVANELVTQSNFETKKSKLKEIQSSLSESIKCHASNLDGYKNDVLEKFSNAETNVMDSKQNLLKDSQLVSKEILQRDLAIEKFISDDLEKDIPTGTTPQRKTYYYSKELIAPSPDEEKLRILRQFRDEHTDIAVNLPLDCSFDERDEFRSPLNQEVCQLTAVNSSESLNNGDDYLTDCETLSNASSTSDLSVTGLKNKENFKSFTKPSLKRPKVKKANEKKTESSIPTPTQRKPLSSKNPSPFA